MVLCKTDPRCVAEDEQVHRAIDQHRRRRGHDDAHGSGMSGEQQECGNAARPEDGKEDGAVTVRFLDGGQGQRLEGEGGKEQAVAEMHRQQVADLAAKSEQQPGQGLQDFRGQELEVRCLQPSRALIGDEDRGGDEIADEQEIDDGVNIQMQYSIS